MRENLLLLLSLLLIGTTTGLPRLPWQKQKSYTPLLFFKVPPGLIPECDAMEQKVQQLEQDLGVRVERLDVLRHPENQAVLLHLTTTNPQSTNPQQRTPPFLYHRESCQSIHIPPTPGSKKKKKSNSSSAAITLPIRDESLRAWAKGRVVIQSKPISSNTRSEGTKPIVLEQKDEAMEQAELLTLTPKQQEGKRLMQERTDAKQQQSSE